MKKFLTDFVPLDDPGRVFEEICYLIGDIYPGFDFSQIYTVYGDVLRIFNGKDKRFKPCNTEYHDLRHTTDVTIAATRLIHGAVFEGKKLDKKNVSLAICSALLHDIGFIQKREDDDGTGAKFTLDHVARGIEFTQNYFESKAYPVDDFKKTAQMILCTDIDMDFSEINFASDDILFLSKIIASADLMGQMADRAYLEKLLFLYREWKDGNIPGPSTELELLKNTISFYNAVQERLSDTLDNVQKYMKSHFIRRWHTDRDYYRESIEKNISYLEYLMEYHKKDYRNYLRRNGIVKEIEEKVPNKKW